MLLGVVYMLIAVTCIGLIEQGWSKRLHLVFILALCNALKFLLFDQWSLFLLALSKLLAPGNDSQ